MRPWPVLLPSLALVACWTPFNDLVTSHVEPGGSVVASINAGPMQTTNALGDGHASPMTIEGTSPQLVFGLVVGNDTSGKDAGPELLMSNASVELDVTATSRSKLSVHLGGSGCDAQQAVVHLTTDGNGVIAGDFSGSGVVSGGTAPCTLAGTLTGIPVDK